MSTPKPPLRSMLELAQDEMIMRDRIIKALREAPKTIPELAACLGYPAHEIMVWLSGLRRYGEVEAKGRPDVDGYFTYEWVDKSGEQTS